MFAFNINYDTQPGNSQVQALYNGNISETTWKTATDLSKRSYGYLYDKLNRLTSAIYSKPNDAIPVSGAYNESLSYDKNGNIKSLQRYGASDAPSIVFQIDDLTYGYLDQNSNQLTKVTDGPAGNDNEGFKDANKTGDDFTYDLNGNMIADKNKNITAIQYNQLNLPNKITFGTNGTIEYIYNATGQKLEKIVKEASSITHTEYLTGFQYSYVISDGYVPDDPGNTDPPIDGTDPVIDPPVEANRFSAFAAQSASLNVPSQPMLQFFPTAEGYYDDIYKKYVYQYKDHLGNVRLSYAKNPVTQVLEIIEENNYYPFGLKHTGYNDYVASNNKYKYNGKELQDELGLNWDSFKWRNYDYAIGRFMNIDPLATEFPQWSPYVFSGNLVVVSKELEGMEPKFMIEDGKLTTGMVSLLNAAYGYSTSSLQQTTWILWSDPRVVAWYRAMGNPNATTEGYVVAHDGGYNYGKGRNDDEWFGLVVHEQSHREDIENDGSLSFYIKYGFQGVSGYRNIDTEEKAFENGSDDGIKDYGDQLLAYKKGEVMDTFKNGGLTNNQKALFLQSTGADNDLSPWSRPSISFLVCECLFAIQEVSLNEPD